MDVSQQIAHISHKDKSGGVSVKRCAATQGEEMGTYNFYANGIRVCPICGAMIKYRDGLYRCVDCHREFEIIGFGTTDKDLEIREVKHETTV